MTTAELEADIIDEVEAAKIQRVALRTARERRYRGTGPAYIDSGKTVLYSRRTVVEWLLAQERPSGSGSGKKNAVAAE